MKTDFKLVRAIRVVCFQLLLAQIFINNKKYKKNIKNYMNEQTATFPRSHTLSFHTRPCTHRTRHACEIKVVVGNLMAFSPKS